MTIRWNVAFPAGILVAAVLACSERPQPLAPLLADATAASATQATSYSGRATVLQATVLGISTTLVDAGPLPPEGGAQDASLVNASVPGLLTAEVLHAATIGQGNASRSEASVAEVALTVAGNTISAGFLEARATAMCTDNGATASGSSDIAALSVNGQTITVSGAPNQTVTLPAGGEVIINEQTSAGQGDITVNALHVIVPGVADVVISSAHADITCQPNPPPPPPPGCTPADFVTGGGWITGTPSAAKANFGVGGGIKHGAFWGHLTYIDHGSGGPQVKGTGVTGYTADATSPTMRHIQGTAEVNGQSGFTYLVDVADNGEPGRNDTFTIRLSGGGYSYSAGGTLDGGGNIQLHAPACQ
ncbi:MAG TPA: choice-of-anchor P family protein [Gemmatimonadales bacterium]|nr:choice-of-anchor P family protein [Gemmatimonadales bacterium]